MEMLGDPQKQATYIILKLLIITLESKTEAGKITFNMFYLSQYNQNIINSTCTQY